MESAPGRWLLCGEAWRAILYRRHRSMSASFPESSPGAARTWGPGVSERPPAEVKACAWTTAMGNAGGGKFMNARDCLVSLGAVAVLVLAMAGSAGGRRRE